MEILTDPHFTECETFGLEMHSFLNVVSVITGLLQVIQGEMNQPSRLDDLVERAFGLAKAIKDGQRSAFKASDLLAFKGDLQEGLKTARAQDPGLQASAGMAEYMQIFEDIFAVLDVRVAELQIREKNPGNWEIFTIEEFKRDFRKFFYAMEQSSKGRYHIVYNVAQQEQIDYLVHFEVTSDHEGLVTMPYLLKDVIRDLIANARKYTPPGGGITIGIAVVQHRLRFVVEDTGMGIPPEEIERVVEFGFRGSNVTGKIRTMGGGFGLTKALHVTRQLGGRMWIDSELNQGTRVTIEVPVPDPI